MAALPWPAWRRARRADTIGMPHRMSRHVPAYRERGRGAQLALHAQCSVLPTRPACRLPRSVPAPVATATTRARAQHGHNQPEAALPISVLNLIALSWESWLIRPPDTREIPSSSLGESTPLDLSESFCPLFFFLTEARSACCLPQDVSWSPGSFVCAAIQGVRVED